ncbi:hypothetical protein Y032_0106g3755 [Ancylostoma ceylanicum]|uniref:Uncharacterized protein n=1 Tax=Ancylostoma ceylanicum TaxID=53326 RepID=A0A016TFU8_9BILA|nr:hypothetical protein Y032_0106g3755 [Ancylostoma ceylanicum]
MNCSHLSSIRIYTINVRSQGKGNAHLVFRDQTGGAITLRQQQTSDGRRVNYAQLYRFVIQAGVISADLVWEQKDMRSLLVAKCSFLLFIRPATHFI